MDYSKVYPHGKCECPEANGQCCGGFGPVAYSVKRDGKELNLCTKCTFPSDVDQTLLVTKDDSADVYLKFDGLGGLCIMFALAKETKT